MRSFELDRWDCGRLIVNRDFAGVLRANGLTTFDALMHYEGGTIAKNVLEERTTTHFALQAGDGRTQEFYIKRHTRPPWKEYVKPLLRLTLPIIGARHEWQAMLRLHELDIPTMTPVALGYSGQSSFVVTEAIGSCTKLSHWMETHLDGRRAENEARADDLISTVAHVARTMHAAGIHHQDLYLTHFLAPRDARDSTVFVLDLGRARCRKRLARRWIVKDLAQLNYSSGLLTASERLRFLRAYLGRPLEPGDRRLIRRIARKTAAIARHSRRNRL